MIRMIYHTVLCCFILMMNLQLAAQTGSVRLFIHQADSGKVRDGIAYVKGNHVQKAVPCDKKGLCFFQDLPYGQYVMGAFSAGYQTREMSLNLTKQEEVLHIYLEQLKGVLPEVEVLAERRQYMTLGGVEGTAIYEAKKSEVIDMKALVVNTANNNTRQIFGKVTGLNIWESDGSGLQLGIGGRGLNPNRTSSFNTRQNGYDISADALGYPESYYTPPAEALERIEVVRGAASLQYGTQFGGLLNFVMKKGPSDTPLEWTSRLSGGSWKFINAFNSLGGTVANGKLSYYAFYQHKRGDGWRPNSDFRVNTAYGALNWQAGKNTRITAEYTHLDYLAHQPGGLTDAQFEDDPSQSLRSRNWFRIDWNLWSLVADIKLGKKALLNIRNFAIHSGRQSLGNLDRMTVADFAPQRTLIDGLFRNIGNESRLLKTYNAFGREHTGVLGFRIYKGNTRARQGDADGGKDPDFTFIRPDQPDNSDYRFPNMNFALFTEQILRVCPKLSIVPGLRWEYIQTEATGYFKQQLKDAAGNLIAESVFNDARRRERSFLLAGLGLSFKPLENIELYANFSQNYRAINFSDLRINNPSLKVDTMIRDESGFTADIGLKGTHGGLLRYELTAFCLYYNDRIGQVLRADQPPLFQDYRFRTNIADARNTGLELLADMNLLPLFSKYSKNSLSVFVNAALIKAIYLGSEEKSVEGNQVEMVPPFMVRSGMTWSGKQFRASVQYSHTAGHYSDASNAVRTSSAVEGRIPDYQVLDASCAYTWKQWTLELSVNNILNAAYFTRRADSYPGPGIIPADARNVTAGIQYVFRKKPFRKEEGSRPE